VGLLKNPGIRTLNGFGRQVQDPERLGDNRRDRHPQLSSIAAGSNAIPADGNVVPALRLSEDLDLGWLDQAGEGRSKQLPMLAHDA